MSTELLKAFSLPLSVLLVGYFANSIAEKKRNDDLFDKRFQVYEDVYMVWRWMVNKRENGPQQNFPPGGLGVFSVAHLGRKAGLLFNNEIGVLVQALIQDAIGWNNDFFYFNHEDTKKDEPGKSFNMNQFNNIPWESFLGGKNNAPQRNRDQV